MAEDMPSIKSCNHPNILFYLLMPYPPFQTGTVCLSYIPRMSQIYRGAVSVKIKHANRMQGATNSN